jgi:hypothetical protein
LKEGGQGMSVLGNLNITKTPTDTSTSLMYVSIDMRDEFQKWLVDGNTKKISPQVAIECLDRISEYVISKKIACSIWEIAKPSIYKPVYQKVMDAKLLRIMERKTYKTFTLVGKLYLKFLKEKPWGASFDNPVIATAHNELSTQNQPEEENKLNQTAIIQTQEKTDNFIFRKDVDLSLLKYGFTIPQSAIDAFCSNISIEVPRGSSYRISLVIKDKAYSATLSNVGFSSEARQQMQVRYSQTSPIANTLRSIFAVSNDLFIAGKKVENKEYIEVVCVSTDKFELICHPLIFASTVKPEAIYPNLNTMDYSLDEIDQKRAKHIIASKFKNGYRITSNIDFQRLKNYYVDEYGEGFYSEAEGLDAFVKSVAVVFDDRAYMYDEEVIEVVCTYLEQMDSPCIYIDTFFEKYSEELYNFGIFSVDMLRAFIEKNYTDVFCKRDYVYLQADASPSDLIRQVFDERETWSFDELFERLPCLKQDTIRAALNGSEYLRIATGVYTHIDNLDLPDSEGEKIVSFVWERLQSRDYVIANELDLSRFEELNPHCPFSAIRDAVYNKFLADHYSKSGQVITRIGEKLRVLDILEQYCREAETASFEELNSFEATFDPEGKTHSACLIAAHNVMVRVSADLFVEESKVSFDVDRTDEAIALYCRDNFIPLKSVVDFSLFPYAGYPWNLFLLESYVRKFSRIFKYDVRAVNSSNIGVIVRKSFTYSEYDDILAIALAKSSLALNNKKAVGDYLFDNGYIGRRNLGKSESKILANAKKIREGGTV